MSDSTPTLVATGFALFLLIGLPVMAAIDARRGVDLEAANEHRSALYVSVALSLSVITTFTLVVMAWQDVTVASVGWRVGEASLSFVWGLAVAAVGLGLTWGITALSRRIGLGESPLATLLMPRNNAEKWGFLLLSGVASVCEELMFRGFLLWVLTGWLESGWFAAAIVALSFGLAHGYQKLAGILRAVVLGMLLAVPTVLTGSLLPAILAHFWINAAVGMGGWRYLLDDDEIHEQTER